ncbi:transposase, partial [Streptomyces sp. NPDC086010]|uniref:transposase n=1 Tax=Streptomyces sp. NPDC086010 TaxID=3365745 RepID=UPI0037CD6F10
MPKPYPQEFREDCGPGVTVEQVAADFCVHAMTLWKWMRRADIDDGTKPGTTSQEGTELREARRRIKLYEDGSLVLAVTDINMATTADDYQQARLFVIEAALQAAQTDARVCQTNGVTRVVEGYWRAAESRPSKVMSKAFN